MPGISNDGCGEPQEVPSKMDLLREVIARLTEAQGSLDEHGFFVAGAHLNQSIERLKLDLREVESD